MSIGFKEWALVCDGIARGNQCVIVRKGGIHEGREGFRFAHREFYLFPTLFHEQVTKLKLSPDTPLPERVNGVVGVGLLLRVEWVRLVTDSSAALALAPFHVLRDELVLQRFQQGEPAGVHVAFFRAYHVSPAWSFPDGPQYGGCRSWVTMPEPPEALQLTPVLSDEAHAERSAALDAVLKL